MLIWTARVSKKKTAAITAAILVQLDLNKLTI